MVLLGRSIHSMTYVQISIVWVCQSILDIYAFNNTKATKIQYLQLHSFRNNSNPIQGLCIHLLNPSCISRIVCYQHICNCFWLDVPSLSFLNVKQSVGLVSPYLQLYSRTYKPFLEQPMATPNFLHPILRSMAKHGMVLCFSPNYGLYYHETFPPHIVNHKVEFV